MSARTYLVVGSKTWNRRGFETRLRGLPGNWHFAGQRDELTLAGVRALRPRFVFFLHWSWKVPDELIREFECVCFHMTDVPYGRGGSPLQNLIVRGQRETKLTALRMTAEFDAGPVYMKSPLSLEGGGEEILIRATERSCEMIAAMVRRTPKPRAQRGAVTVFKRRQSEESRLGGQSSLTQVHDVVRMLDASGYPKAFIEHGGFRYEFSRAALYDGRVVADVTITRSVSSASGV